MKPRIHFCPGYPRLHPSQSSVSMHEQELSRGQGTKSEHELILAAPALGNTRESAKYSPRKRELGWVQLNVYIAEGLGSSFPTDVQSHEKLYLAFQKRCFNLRKNRTLTWGKATGLDALVFQDALQTFRRNYRQEYLNVFCKSSLCPVSSKCKPIAEASPTMAVEMHKHHELRSRTGSLLTKSRLSKYSQPQKISRWQHWVESSRLEFCLKSPILPNSGQGRKDLLCPHKENLFKL